jgi:hypothetical protein
MKAKIETTVEKIKTSKTEREEAIAADKLLIKKGKEPVNILVRK